MMVSNYAIWRVDTTADNLAVALILAAAVKAGADSILSEDLNSGQRISGIRIKNPLR